MSPKEIQENLALEYEPDQIQDVNVPKGTDIESGPVGDNKWGPGNQNITQYRLKARIPNENFEPPVKISLRWFFKIPQIRTIEEPVFPEEMPLKPTVRFPEVEIPDIIPPK
jgi:hypothetical protein